MVLGAFALGRAEAAPPAGIQVPVGLPVSLDGYPVVAEWADAVEVPGGEGVGRLRMKQQRGVLLLTFESDRAWVRGTHLMVVTCPDWPEAHATSPGAVQIDFEPLEHARPHLMVQKMGDQGPSPLVGQALVRARLGGRSSTLEMALKLPALGVTGAKPPGLRMVVALLRGKEHGSPTWPQGLDIAASVKGPPKDLIESGRWTRLSGWVDQDGPGAWPARDWEAWQAEDKEMTEKGLAAHAKGMMIAEEAGRKLEKQDRDVQHELLDAFEWIARKEPLHPFDVLVKGQALRHLNRHEEALATFEGLALERQDDFTPSALGERALTLEQRERYEEAADVWRALDAITTGTNAGRYARLAQLAENKIAARDQERAARVADDRDADLPLIELETTHGIVLVRLHAKDVPKAVAHFLKLVESPGKDGGRFYDSTRFHRVLGNALAQGGDPRTRNGDCEQELAGPASATVEMEINARHGFWRGALAFARAAKPENASQFFVLVSPRPSLAEEKYTVFGHVVAGIQVIDRLERCDELKAVRVLHAGVSASAPKEPPPPAPPGSPAPPAESPPAPR